MLIYLTSKQSQEVAVITTNILQMRKLGHR